MTAEWIKSRIQSDNSSQRIKHRKRLSSSPRWIQLWRKGKCTRVCNKKPGFKHIFHQTNLASQRSESNRSKPITV
eukprot:14192165-Ditylum_brightwellii.AAC.1